MRLLDVNPGKGPNQYRIEAEDDSTFFPGRCAAIIGPNNVRLGYLGKACCNSILYRSFAGALHPEVITAFGLTLPCCAIEINIEPFL